MIELSFPSVEYTLSPEQHASAEGPLCPCELREAARRLKEGWAEWRQRALVRFTDAFVELVRSAVRRRT